MSSCPRGRPGKIVRNYWTKLWRRSRQWTTTLRSHVLTPNSWRRSGDMVAQGERTISSSRLPRSRLIDQLSLPIKLPSLICLALSLFPIDDLNFRLIPQVASAWYQTAHVGSPTPDWFKKSNASAWYQTAHVGSPTPLSRL